MNHEVFMKEALKEARIALDKGEVPVGAVVVLKGEIIGRGHNLRELENDPTAHAEVLALREAAKRLKGWRLEGAAIYVTLEPCPMCAGALLQSRIERVVYGIEDPKAGSAGSLINILQFPGFNHEVKITSGILAQECKELLQDFFRNKRKSARI